MDTLECNSDQATVGWVVLGGQPYKLCVLCEIGFKDYLLLIKKINGDERNLPSLFVYTIDLT